jgi:hypothetical protein
MMAALARLPVGRLAGGVVAWIALGAWTMLAFSVAALVHTRGAAHGADVVLIDTVGALVIPLLAYGLVGAALGGRSLSASGASLVAFGADPARAAAATIAVAAGACAAAGAVIAAGVALLAHGAADPAPLGDALASAYAGGLGGAAYGCWFALGASFGRRGGGRVLLLLVDWGLGAAGGAAVVTPRGHLRNLFGGEAPDHLSGRASSVALLLIACLCALVGARRCRT